MIPGLGHDVRSLQFAHDHGHNVNLRSSFRNILWFFTKLTCWDTWHSLGVSFFRGCTPNSWQWIDRTWFTSRYRVSKVPYIIVHLLVHIYDIFLYIYVIYWIYWWKMAHMHIYIIISYIYIIFGIFEGGIKSLITSSMWLEHLPLNAHGTSTYVTPWAMHLGTTGDGGFKCWNTIEPSGFNAWWYQFWLYPLVI